MHLDTSMVAVINRKKYATSDATIIASDEYWDGHNWERRGRNQWLLRGKNGNYFLQTQTQWQGERNTITALTKEDAIEIYEQLPEHEVEFEQAFPGVTVEEA